MSDDTRELAPGFAELGLLAFTTTRKAGSFAWQSDEPAHAVFDRWQALRAALPAPRLASAHQVHGARILTHGTEWEGLLRCGDADGHLALHGATAMAVSLADCVPVFLGHPSGVGAVVHSGWRGTAAGIAQQAVDTLVTAGFPAAELVAHCGPAICGRCYVVGPEVHAAIVGRATDAPAPLDLRAAIAAALEARGVPQVTISPWCTRCHNTRFFSHRCGDAGRQLGVLVTAAA